MSRRIKIIFTLSLLLNLVLVGIGGGLLYRFTTQEVPIPGEMSPEARHFVARTFQEGREQVRPLIGTVKERRARVERIIMAEDFDLDAYNEAVSDMLDTRDEISRQRALIMGRALVDLPAVDRQKFSRRLLDSLEGRKPHKRGYHQKIMCEKKAD